jgi:hypothetical protein
LPGFGVDLPRFDAPVRHRSEDDGLSVNMIIALSHNLFFCFNFSFDAHTVPLSASATTIAAPL